MAKKQLFYIIPNNFPVPEDGTKYEEEDVLILDSDKILNGIYKIKNSILTALMHNYSEESIKIDNEMSLHPILTIKMSQTRGQDLNKRKVDRLAKLQRNSNIQHLEKDIN